jgi:hypothetical protein
MRLAALGIACSLLGIDLGAVIDHTMKEYDMIKKLAEEEKAKRAKATAEEKRKAELFKRSRTNHKPGKRHKLPDGTTYQVSKSGAWVRTSLRLTEKKKSRQAVMDRLLGAN